MQAEDEEPMFSRFRSIVKNKNYALVDFFEKRFVAIETRQEQLEQRIQNIERKLGRIWGAIFRLHKALRGSIPNTWK